MWRPPRAGALRTRARATAGAAHRRGAERLEEHEQADMENLLSGRNPIREALKSGRDIEQLLVARGELSGSAR